MPREVDGNEQDIAELIRARVHDEQQITCSVGVATTKFVAKLASTRAKPDGMLVVPADQVIAFLHPLARALNLLLLLPFQSLFQL